MRRVAALVLLLAVTPPLCAEQPINQLKGFNANNVYSTHDIEPINVFNGNLTVSIPIGPEFPVGAGFSYRLTLHANSNLWDSEVESSTTHTPYLPQSRELKPLVIGACDPSNGFTVAYPHRRANAGLGWTLTLGRLYPPSDPTARVWTYESPDGADHEFQAPTFGAEPLYTADGSYLRMKTTATGDRTIEFPDGSIHRFVPPDNGGPGPWMPKEMKSRHSASSLTIDYVPTANGLDWVLRDSHNREHRVIFTRLPWDGAMRLLVTKVKLEAFTPPGQSQRYAEYDFIYETAFIRRPEWHEPCPGSSLNSTLQKLTQVIFPGDPSTDAEGETKYTFTYDTAPVGSPGVLAQATLPTGGIIRWEWTTYDKPQQSASDNAPYLATSVGVGKRKLLKPAVGGSVLHAQWIYESILNSDYEDINMDTPVRELRTTVIDPLGNQTVSYFSVSLTTFGSWRADEYGKPFTKFFSDATGTRWLSTVTYPPSATPDIEHPLAGAIRANYVRYESDGPPTNTPIQKNWRIASTRTLTRNTLNGDDFVDSASSNYDGLGHYRTVTVSGSSGGTTKTTTTNYNPDRGTFPDTFTMVPTSAPWVLNTFTSVQVQQGGDSSTTDYCFNASTGFLERKRIRRSGDPTKDLLVVFTPDSFGNVVAEKNYGGDVTALPANFVTCSGNADALSPAFTITNTFQNGMQATSEYSGAGFKSADITVDKSGLPRSSRDTAQVQTTYVYNPLGQLREVHPAGEAWVEYTYSMTPLSVPRATVIARRWDAGTPSPPPAADVPLAETRYFYDEFGRLIQQRQRMPGLDGGNLWAASITMYDVLGRVASQSVPVGEFGALSAPSTSHQYDPLGRVTRTTQPDGKFVTIEYLEGNVVERKVEVKTGPGPADTTHVATQETYDSHGRLVQVTEDSNGAAVPTFYEYDEGDRLKRVKDNAVEAQVVQRRMFDYDGAGFLMSELHPESGTTTYEYDARGHITKRVTPTATLTFTYDAAERVKTLHQQGVGEIKFYNYDLCAGDADKCKGKMVLARRHNRHGSDDTIVTETFTYAAIGGRLSNKTTAVQNGPTFTDAYAYDQTGNRTGVTYPGCTSGCGILSAPSRTVTNIYEQGYLRRVAGYTDATQLIGYHPNGLLRSLRHRNVDPAQPGPVYQQTIDANGMARPASISVAGYCSDFRITQEPPASQSVAAGAVVSLQVAATGATSFEWYRDGETQAIATHSGSSSTLNVPVNATTSFWARAKNGICSVDSRVSTVTVSSSCPAPDATITSASSLNLGATGTASVAEAASYHWAISAGGIITSASNVRNITFRSCGTSVTLTVTVTASCGTQSPPSSRTIAVNQPVVTVSGTPSMIAPGQSATISATVNGAGPWDIKWSDGSTLGSQQVSPAATTTYSIVEINGCPGSYGSTSIAVQQPPPPAPSGVTALGLSETSVRVDWVFNGTADRFVVERCESSCHNAVSWRAFDHFGTSPFFDPAAIPNRVYVYRVRAVRSNVSSAASNVDVATTIAFTPVFPAPMRIKALHLQQLRIAVNAIRVAAGMGPIAFTNDPILTTTRVKALHFTELQTALYQARVALQLPPPSFSPTASRLRIRTNHVTELSGGVQ